MARVAWRVLRRNRNVGIPDALMVWAGLHAGLHGSCLTSPAQGKAINKLRERAHQLWEAAGRPEGKEDHLSLEAERQFREERIRPN
jgi:hypothetical protein